MANSSVSNNTTTLLFDHDGTLINSERVHFTLWREIVASYGAELTDEFYCKVMAGIPVKQNAKDVVEHFSLDVEPEQLAKKKHDKVEAYLSQQAFPLMPHAGETIKACADAGFTIGIVTGGSTLSVEKTLTNYGLAQYISCVVAVEDVTYSKPAPDCYQLAMEKLGVSPGECIAIEDTYTGMQSALSAELACVVIPTTQSATHDFTQATSRYESLQLWVEQEITGR
ncbi:HAD family phosphatase [Alteromonas stellipolaris]|uniref:HAD family hydrolase n=1 Tax=Alteromonas stellipolaris TaxID=233316 RepID=UPI002117582A|nr:HAD family phosphatase [Alteromonas stellipolaris]MCQ8849898.1 HAD family phosphatase [Alteromonas stellipolaris]